MIVDYQEGIILKVIEQCFAPHGKTEWSFFFGFILVFLSVIISETKLDFLKRKTKEQEIEEK